RISHDHAGFADDDWHVVDSDVEPIEERLNLGLGLDLLVGERLPVSAEELSDTEGGRRVPGADEDQAAAAVGDESYPPENEGAHEDLAELEVSLYERTQVLAIHDDDRSIDGGARANEIAACGEHVDLTRELAGAEHPHHVFAAGDGAHDLDAALDDEEEAGILLAGLQQHVARPDVPPLADTGDSG